MVMPSQESQKKAMDVLIKNGPWAILFTALLVFVMWANNAREMRYLKTIDTLTEQMSVMDLMQRDIADIKDVVVRGRGR
jgi:hypothetical protein